MTSIQQQQQQQYFLLASSDPADKVSISSLTSPSLTPWPSSSSMASPALLLSSTAKATGFRHWQSQPLLRTKASTQLSPFHAQAHPCQSLQSHSPHHQNKTTSLDVPRQSHTSTSIAQAAAKIRSFSEWSRTQHKLMLQRQSFLANDKHHLDNPANMKRLTKEMDRMNREYRCVRHYEDPMTESFLRVSMAAYHHHPTIQSSTSPQFSPLSSSSTSSSTSSSLSSSGLLDSALPTTRNACNNNYTNPHYYHHHHHQQQQQQQQQPLGKISSPILQRRASDFMQKQQERRNSSSSIHSAIIERSHHPTSVSSSKNYFFARWFKPTLPLTKRHQLHPTC